MKRGLGGGHTVQAILSQGNESSPLTSSLWGGSMPDSPGVRLVNLGKSLSHPETLLPHL